MEQLLAYFWSVSATEMLQPFETPKEGLTGGQARQRLARYGRRYISARALESSRAKTAVGCGLKDLRNAGPL
jgi:hypothetical protein